MVELYNMRNFMKKYKNKINIVEIEQDKKIKNIYNIQPGEDRCRWNIESIYYNQNQMDYMIILLHNYLYAMKYHLLIF